MKIKKIILLLIIAVFFSGCSISFGGKSSGNNGGVFLSTNKGDSWAQRSSIPTTSGSPKNISSLNASSFIFDPSDNNALYFGSLNNGLFYTYNNGTEWKFVDSLNKETILDVAVDPDSKCVIYVTIGNKVYQSTDCSRNWAQVYYDNDINITINSIAIDYYSSLNLYIGTSRGEVIKSSDRGRSWKTIGRFEDSVKRIKISPHDSRIVFVATAKKGIFRSDNGGESWIDLKEGLKDFKNSLNFRDLELSVSENNLIFLATNYGLLKSSDNGKTWFDVNLITPEKEAIINSVAISPKNAKEIYYVTNTTFYRSLDGGENWTSKKLPTLRAGWKLLIDPENTSNIYMGVKEIKN